MIKVRVLGCDGGQLPGFSQVSFFMNDHLLLDAGSITSTLPLRDQHKIRQILITHGHLDHTKDLCFLGENLYLSGGYRRVQVYSSDAILTDIRKNLFNGIVWPDLSKVPVRKPVYSLRSIKRPLKLGKLTVKAVSVPHSHSALAYILSDKKGTIAFTGDTGPTTELWQEVNKAKNLKAVFMECSFPAALADLAWQTKHLSVTTLVREIDKIKDKKVPIYLYHLKPVYFNKINAEIKRLGMKRLRILKPKTTLNF